jgi:hypothetical protein
MKAFGALGWETKWLDANDNVDPNSFPPGTIFLTEGQVDKNIPLRYDCFYILHNVTVEKYKDIPDDNKMFLQVYMKSENHDDLHDSIVLSEASTYVQSENMLYTMWATDLLPEEIDIEAAIDQYSAKKKAVIFIGSLDNSGSTFSNGKEVLLYADAGQREGYQWIHYTSPFANPVESIAQRKLIGSCELAPAIVGNWQQMRGYIPCRIFKSISYGCLGITNSKYVFELLDRHIIYHNDSKELFNMTLEFLRQDKEIILDALKTQMELVRDKHTYINRVQDILKVVKKVKGFQA